MSANRMQFEPDSAWWQHLFAAIDSLDAKAFADHLTPDAQFRLGNAPTILGRDAIVAAASGFFASIAACRHRLIRSWSGSDGVGCEGEVTYTRRDGRDITVPFANIFELRGTLICAYRVYVDNSPLAG